MRRPRMFPADADIHAVLRALNGPERRELIHLLGPQQLDALDRHWSGWAHEGQLAPPGDWSTWVLKAGRGFGKTLAGAQWIESLIASEEPLRIALVGATLDDARRVMVEGKSGLLEVADAWIAEWRPSRNRLRFRTGAEATLFTGATPHLLRGPEHHYAWCDELAKWERPQESWDMLQMGLRLGSHPRVLVTTTPRPGPVLKAIMDDPATEVTGGATRENPHLPRAYRDRVERLYGGTRLGRQELEGELLPDVAGALWTVELIERCRVELARFEDFEPFETAPRPAASGLRNSHSERHEGPSRRSKPQIFTRTLIAVDPPTGDGTCGIVACARDDAGMVHVLADHSVTARSPEGWAAAVAAAALAHDTAEIVAEANQGGQMVKSVLNTADAGLRVRLVNARTGKSHRAEPVAHLFEAGRVVLHGHMRELEAQLLGMVAGGGYEGPGISPDRADAMVWGVTELALARDRVPRIWSF